MAAMTDWWAPARRSSPHKCWSDCPASQPTAWHPSRCTFTSFEWANIALTMAKWAPTAISPSIWSVSEWLALASSMIVLQPSCWMSIRPTCTIISSTICFTSLPSAYLECRTCLIHQPSWCPKMNYCDLVRWLRTCRYLFYDDQCGCIYPRDISLILDAWKVPQPSAWRNHPLHNQPSVARRKICPSSCRTRWNSTMMEGMGGVLPFELQLGWQFYRN